MYAAAWHCTGNMPPGLGSLSCILTLGPACLACAVPSHGRRLCSLILTAATFNASGMCVPTSPAGSNFSRFISEHSGDVLPCPSPAAAPAPALSPNSAAPAAAAAVAAAAAASSTQPEEVEPQSGHRSKAGPIAGRHAAGCKCKASLLWAGSFMQIWHACVMALSAMSDCFHQATLALCGRTGLSLPIPCALPMTRCGWSWRRGMASTYWCLVCRPTECM